MPCQEQAPHRDIESKEELSRATSREIFESWDSNSYFPLSHPELCASQGFNSTLDLAKFFNFEYQTRTEGANFLPWAALSVSYTHLRAHETPEHLVCRL